MISQQTRQTCKHTSRFCSNLDALLVPLGQPLKHGVDFCFFFKIAAPLKIRHPIDSPVHNFCSPSQLLHATCVACDPIRWARAFLPLCDFNRTLARFIDFYYHVFLPYPYIIIVCMYTIARQTSQFYQMASVKNKQ